MENQGKMAALMQPQDFRFEAKLFEDLESRQKLLKNTLTVLEKHGFTNTLCEKDGSDSPAVILVCADNFERHAAFRMYKTGLATLDLQTPPGTASRDVTGGGASQNKQKDVTTCCDGCSQRLPWGDFYNGSPHTDVSKSIYRELRKVFPLDSLDGDINFPWPEIPTPVLQRDRFPSVYNLTSDSRMTEYDFESCLYNVRSDFQRVHIFKSKNFGNLLCLDGWQNLAESDLIYTQTILNIANEDYSGKEVLILGGGDGGILNELVKLERPPKFVTMIEIDKMVIEGCKKYMRSVCGDVFDKMSGDRYEIIIDDCFVWLDKYMKEGRQFDFVLCDLTDAPIGDENQDDQDDRDNDSEETWDLLRQAFTSAMKVLRPGGKLLTHANGVSCSTALQRYEDELGKLEIPVKFERATAFVPSFMESWAFYRISKR